ncbi:MAG: hypothetical protein ACYDB2_00160 [Acidimicrobiales bacterium]
MEHAASNPPLGPPGAALVYCLGGFLIALPERSWSSPPLGRTILRVMAVMLVSAALLKAWPGRGFWHGYRALPSASGTLTGMIRQMPRVRQSHLPVTRVNDVRSFEAAHGWPVHLCSVVAVALIGAGFLSRRPRVLRATVVAGVVFCVADSVLVEEMGIFGGVGTDPKRMIPLALFFIAGNVDLTKLPAGVSKATQSSAAAPEAYHDSWRERRVTNPTYLVRTFRAIDAMTKVMVKVMVMVGVVPVAVASTNTRAEESRVKGARK